MRKVFLIGGLGVGQMLLLLIGAALKEDPVFFRNEGGYPIWLRELVLVGFYPFLGASLAMCVAVTLLSFRMARRPVRWGLWGTPLLLWTMLLGAVVLVAWNNVENLLNGRPLHYHPGRK